MEGIIESSICDSTDANIVIDVNTETLKGSSQQWKHFFETYAERNCQKLFCSSLYLNIQDSFALAVAKSLSFTKKMSSETISAIMSRLFFHGNAYFLFHRNLLCNSRLK